MPSSAFLLMNDNIRAIYANDTQATWYRPGGPVGGELIDVIFDAPGAAESLEDFSMVQTKAKAIIFSADIFAIDPSRASAKPNEILRNNGRDRLKIDGGFWRVESCVADGFDKVLVTLLED